MRRNPTLPTELVNEEILLRLLVKSLLRFKAVNREWRDLISSLDFAKAHFNSRYPHTDQVRLEVIHPLLFILNALMNWQHRLLVLICVHIYWMKLRCCAFLCQTSSLLSGVHVEALLVGPTWMMTLWLSWTQQRAIADKSLVSTHIIINPEDHLLVKFHYYSIMP